MNVAGGAAYGAADDFMQCPACHGFGFVDNGLSGGRANRRSGGRSRGGNAQNNGLGVLVLVGLGYLGLQWLGDNKQAVTGALWSYVVLPLAALIAAVLAFFLLRFLWRCGKWSFDGMLRYSFNLVVLTITAFLAWAVAFGMVVGLVQEFAPGFELPLIIARSGLILATGLTGLVLTSRLSRKYGRLGYAWDLLRGRKSALARQVSNAVLPLLKKPGGGWFGVTEWNDPFVRGFIDAQGQHLIRRRHPNMSDKEMLDEYGKALLTLILRCRIPPQAQAALLPGDKLTGSTAYRSGVLAGLMFLKHYHRVGLTSHVSDALRDAVTARFHDFTGGMKKPGKMARPGFARRTLVKGLWHPHLSSIAPPAS